MKIVCIGAGVANCIVLRALQNCSSVDTVCLEQSAPGEHTNSGTGLNIGPNALAALSVTDPQLHQNLIGSSFPWESWRVSLVNGQNLFCLPLRQLTEHAGIRIRWAELFRVLRQRVDSLIRYNSRTIKVGRDREKLIVEYVSDGSVERIEDADLILAGDGRYSLTRRQLLGEPPTSLFGVAIGRLLIPRADTDLIDDYEQWFHGANRLLAFRVPDNDVYTALTFPLPPEHPLPEETRCADFLRQLYEPADGRVSKACAWLIDRIADASPEIHWARFQDAPPAYFAARKQVLFLGDAAHPLLPTLGQGATQAIEDGCMVAELIRTCFPHGEIIVEKWQEQLVETYFRLRHERIAFVAQFSRDAADTLLAGADPVQGTRNKMKPEFLSKLKCLYTNVCPADRIRSL